ncbi:MAG: PqqD family protein [Burkholderiales bacterium]
MKITVPESVLSTELQDEGVLLNLETGEYFGLDEVGLDMWKVLGATGTLDAAQAALLDRYDVAEDVLAGDLRAFVAQLAERRLVVLTDE